VNVFKGFEQVNNISRPILTIGTFDGVHLGHQKIIQQLNEIAENVNGESVLFTFYPHPRMVLFPDNHGLKLIQTQAEKLQKLQRTGLKNVVVYPFSNDFSRVSAVNFIRDFLVNELNVHTVIIGYDHQFGKNREGSLSLLQELAPIYDFNVIEIKAQDIDDVNVSSTKIRTALTSGDIMTANKYLGEPFELTGKVVHGQKIGRSLGYPTANLDLESDVKIIPKDGVYFVKVYLEQRKPFIGILNIGMRPTIYDNEHQTIEVHILDFKEEIYGKHLTLVLLERLRNEIKFDSKDQLQEQIIKDEKQARNIRHKFSD
jgi:riboflavin kinase/FMN adenylyltransferase